MSSRRDELRLRVALHVAELDPKGRLVTTVLLTEDAYRADLAPTTDGVVVAWSRGRAAEELGGVTIAHVRLD